MLKAHSRLIEQLMLAGDLILVAASWLLAYLLRFYVVGPPLYEGQGVPPIEPYLYMLIPILIVWGVSFHAFDLYRPRRLGSRLSEVTDIAKASTLAALVLVTVMTFVYRQYEFSRVVIVYFWLLSIATVAFSRYVFREGLRVARRRGKNRRFAVIVGSGELAHTVHDRIWRRPDVGIQVLGVVGDDKEGSGNRWLGSYADLRSVLDGRQVDHVILALPHEDYGRLAGLLDAIGDEPVTIHLVPDLLRFTSLRGGVEDFEGMPLIHLRESPLHGWNRLLKRVFDVAFAGATLVLLSPVLLAVAAAVKASSPGPAFFGQERMGLDGQRFRMLKFRTMQEGAEDETGPVWAQDGDPRRTRLGAFLRRFSIDELPQFVNVLRGEMSVVGPRPERPVFVEEFRRSVPGYMLRHKVKSGITGWAQVHGLRGNTSLDLRIRYDIEYIEAWSFWLDLKIIALTIVRVLFDRNAY
ncbi:MAG: undecaprenyl-phosphate glucose phosphotransferase [Candidatus Rokubacteria bacterium]|nr:undecaprenyl-phosphate glucose phosphotransferase [Candidatus Rokubacteria bacterium]